MHYESVMLKPEVYLVLMQAKISYLRFPDAQVLQDWATVLVNISNFMGALKRLGGGMFQLAQACPAVCCSSIKCCRVMLSCCTTTKLNQGNEKTRSNHWLALLVAKIDFYRCILGSLVAMSKEVYITDL